MAACPHAAIAGQRGPRAQWFRRAGLAGCGRPVLRTKSMMHRRGAGTGCEIPGAGGRCSRFRADIKSAPTVWTEVHAVGGVPGPGGGGGPMWASAPTRRNHRTSRKSGAGPGGHTGRPYEETGGGSVGAACMAARAHRRVGCTIAERTPHGIDNKSTIAERTRHGARPAMVPYTQGRWSIHPHGLARNKPDSPYLRMETFKMASVSQKWS